MNYLFIVNLDRIRFVFMQSFLALLRTPIYDLISSRQMLRYKNFIHKGIIKHSHLFEVYKAFGLKNYEFKDFNSIFL